MTAAAMACASISFGMKFKNEKALPMLPGISSRAAGSSHNAYNTPGAIRRAKTARSAKTAPISTAP